MLGTEPSVGHGLRPFAGAGDSAGTPNYQPFPPPPSPAPAAPGAAFIGFGPGMMLPAAVAAAAVERDLGALAAPAGVTEVSRSGGSSDTLSSSGSSNLAESLTPKRLPAGWGPPREKPAEKHFDVDALFA